MKILVAEDTEDSRILIEDQLRVNGFEVDSATNGVEALEKANSAPPDLIISDILMPEMDGFDFCREVKKSERLQKIPFIFYTATYVEPKDKELALSLGASRYLVKPMDISEFICIIDEVLEEYLEGSLAIPGESELPDNGYEKMHSERLTRKLDKKVKELALEREALEKSEARLCEAQRIANIGHWDWNILNNELSWSDQIFHILGLQPSKHEPAFETFFKLIHSEDREVITKAVNEALTLGTSFSIDHRICLSDGEIRCVHQQVKVFRDKTDKPIRIMGTVHDISERSQSEAEQARLQRELQQAQKMEVLGQLTAGIAHDFNNILNIILGNTELAINRCALDSQAKLVKYLKRVEKAGERAKNTVAQLLVFSRSGIQNDKPVQLEPLLVEELKMLRSSLPASIGIDTRFEKNLPSILMNPGQLNQLLMNLCVNARDAMGGKGVITIQLGWSRNVNAECSICHKQVEDDWIELSISDSGYGIKPEVLESIFEPFYTTKEIGKGTGMGLAVISGIVISHQGHILVDTELGIGTTFRLLFPPFYGETSKIPEVSQPSADLPYGKGEHILVLDDEPDLAAFLHELLESHDYRVTTLTDSTKALELFKEDPGRFSLLLTDQSMPGITGLELVKILRDIRPDLPVILITGSIGDIDEKERIKTNIHFLNKPIKSKNLIRTVGRLVNNGIKK